MSLRKQVIKDVSDTRSGDQEEEDTRDDGDDNEELSSSLLCPVSSKEKQRQERENKSIHKEMTEEEMMDLALRLSEHEASIAALRMQEDEEEAMLKAIQESIMEQTQPCPPSPSQSLLGDPEGPLRTCSRRKLVFPNRKAASASAQGASEDSDLNPGTKRGGAGSQGNRKRKWREGSLLLEMSDMSQTQKINSQASLGSSGVLDLPLDSPQSSDSTQIDDCQLQKSPVFPSSGCRLEVHIPRLSEDLLHACRTSGFICSQDNCFSPLWPVPAQSKSPTFPRSPKRHTELTVFSEKDKGDDGAPEHCRSNRHEKSPIRCRSPVGVRNSGLMISSQESLSPSVTSTSCRPQSPVFPRSPDPPGPSGTNEAQAVQSPGHRTSPVFGESGRPQHCLSARKHCLKSSAEELRGPRREEVRTAAEDPSWSLTDGSQAADGGPVPLNQSSQSGRAEIPKDSDVPLVTSDMKLLWSDDDDDVTPLGSPCPVFPEESPDGQPASVNHLTAAPPGLTRSNCRPSSSSASTGQTPLSGAGEPSGGSTVHYYWGVPFCPRGLDPESYTQVIVAQMEVYEKSLKQAQRCLLRKAEWGEAILPQPEKSPPSSHQSPDHSPQELPLPRRGLRQRSKATSDAAYRPPVEAEEVEEDGKGEAEDEQRERNDVGEDEQVDIDDWEVCPETQLSDNDQDQMQDLILVSHTGEKLPSKSPELSEVDMILQDDSPTDGELQEEEEIEVDAPVDRQTEGNTPGRSSQLGGQVGNDQEVEEDWMELGAEETKDRGLQRSTSPELELLSNPQIPDTSVDCPICQGSFPLTEIEIHAAYCDGDVVVTNRTQPKHDSYQVPLKPRRKRTKGLEDNDSSGAARNMEKCYICQTAVPLRDYSRHKELCLQRHEAKTAAKESLLSALHKTERRDPDSRPSGSRLQPGDVIDLRNDDDDDDEDEGDNSAIRISNSPIRSFTPISEATDCLIDFRKQHRPRKPGQKRR